MVRDVFISYCPPDAACAFELVADLERRCVNCLIAPRDMSPSMADPLELIDAVPDSGAMILLFSAHSINPRTHNAKSHGPWRSSSAS